MSQPSPGDLPPGMYPPGMYPPGFEPPTPGDASTGIGSLPSGFYPPGFYPDGFYPPGIEPAPPAPVLVRDLDLDLVAFLAVKLGITASPVVEAPRVGAPSICYTLVAEDPTMRLAGASGLASRTYQLDFRSIKVVEAVSLAERCRLALQGFRGLMGTNTIRGVFYKRIPLTFTQGPTNTPNVGIYRVAAEVRISFRQSVPTF